MKKLITSLLGLAAAGAVFAQTVPTANDPAAMNNFIDQLMAKMTIEEKIGQLNLPSAGDITTGQAKSSDIGSSIKRGEVGGLFNIKGVEKIRDVQRVAVEESRLGIPLIFGMDVIHGYETTFPIPLGLTATWDPAAVERATRISAVEASASGICWTFSPMVDISRDPRWGRVSEGVGEDPFLGSKMAKAMVYGYQGRDNTNYANDEIMACVKHYALYGAGEGGRDYNTVDMSRQRMYNEYFAPYKAAIDAGVGSVMASFNEVEGIPATANRWLMTDVLRGEWNFDGFVVSDYTGVSEMIDHGIGDLQEVSARALSAGVDMDMVSAGFVKTLKKSFAEGRASQAELDLACRRILEAKYKLGLFADPYKYCDTERAAKQVYTDAHRAEARKTAAESFVLLKNEGDILPLKKSAKIAVVGPLAQSRENMPGTWSVATVLSRPLTLVEGITAAAGKKAQVVYAKGSNVCHDPVLQKNATVFGRDIPRDERTAREMIEEALKTTADADVIVAALGETSEMSGESSSRSNIDIPDAQKELLEAMVATGKPVVLVLFAGRPMTLSWEAENVPSILNVWFAGSEAAEAISDVLFGEVNPSGKLPSSFPRNVGQIPIHYNHKNTGRPLGSNNGFEKFRSNYLDVANTPLYPFGYGLSYTAFEYGPLTLSSNEMDAAGQITATVKITNTGKRDGAEIVQLYIRDMVGSVTRPVQELKGFKKVMLKAGESKEVLFKIDAELLKFYNHALEYVYEPGEFDVMVGGSSDKVQHARFNLK